MTWSCTTENLSRKAGLGGNFGSTYLDGQINEIDHLRIDRNNSVKEKKHRLKSRDSEAIEGKNYGKRTCSQLLRQPLGG